MKLIASGKTRYRIKLKIGWHRHLKTPLNMVSFLLERVNMRKETIEVGSKWKHFKGFILEVKLIAKHTETLEDMVIYEHSGELWARPIGIFLSDEDISNRSDNITKQKYRFERID